MIAVVPPSLHHAIADAVATARKALLIEKPLATTAADAAAIVRRLRDAGVPCLMAHTLRWNAVAAALRERLPDLGPLRALVVNQRFEPSPLDWLDRPELSGGGILLHTGVHSFDLVRWLTGCEVTRVWCRTARAITVSTEDNFLATLELAGSDALVAVGGSRATAGRSGLVDAACRDAQLVGDHQQHWLHLVRGLERVADRPGSAVADRPGGGPGLRPPRAAPASAHPSIWPTAPGPSRSRRPACVRPPPVRPCRSRRCRTDRTSSRDRA